MRERGLAVDHATIFRRVQRYAQDHRAIRRRWRAMHAMRKGHVKRLNGRDAAWQAKFVAGLFGAAA